MEPKTLTQREIATRSRQMANEVTKLLAGKMDLSEALTRVADKHGVDVRMVRVACRENRVRLRRDRYMHKGVTVQTLRIVGELMKGRRDADIARDYNLSRERVGQIKRNATEAGLLKDTPKWHSEIVRAMFFLRQFPQPRDANYQQGMKILQSLVEGNGPAKPSKG